MTQAPDTGATRVVRGLVCAAVSLLLGGLAHGLSKGHLPGPGSMVLAFGALATVGIAFADKERGFVFITAVLSLAQLGLHLGFTLVTMAGTAGAHGTGHQGTWAPVANTGQAASTWPMLTGHLLATLGSAACMAYAERVVWRLARMVAPLLRFLLLRPQPIHVAAMLGLRADAPERLPARHGVRLARRRLRRGPPRPAPVFCR